MGRAVGTLRYLGMVTIMLNDYPFLKYILIGNAHSTYLYLMIAINLHTNTNFLSTLDNTVI